MKTEFIFVLFVGIFCCLICPPTGLPQVGFPFDQQLLSKVPLNLQLNQPPQSLQAPLNSQPQLNQAPSQSNQAPQFPLAPRNQAPQNNNAQQPIRSSNYPPNQRLAKPDDEYVFSWKWACRQSTTFDSCQGLFYWNEKLIAHITPSDYTIHTATYKIKGRNGVNRLRIEGAGTLDGLGLIIDDVSIVKKGKSHNYVVNGDFETPNQYEGYNFYTDVSGWTGRAIEIGRGTIYNPFWTSQVSDIDGNSANSQLNQNITLKIQSAGTKRPN